MIDFDFIKDCCGCGACVDACPKRCINMVRSPYGYLVASVNKGECVSCNVCERVCPTMNTPRRVCNSHRVYSAFNRCAEIRDAGSSGSIFYLLATTIIRKGGVVYGAAFDNRLQLKHTKAESEEELWPLLKSKYIQSNTIGVFAQVKQDLNGGKTILFVGTPCQVSALYNYIPEKQKNNLYLVDFICHGVPAQELFDRSIANYERHHKCHINKFMFRVKGKRHSKYYQINYTDESGNKGQESGPYFDNPYYCSYSLYNCFRQSCYRCKHATVDRVSDITLADFWGINRLKPSVTDIEKGYSMLIMNSDKGETLFNSVKNNVIYEEFKLRDAIDNNYSYTNVTNDSWMSKAFRWAYSHLPYRVVERIFCSKYLSYSKRIIDKISKYIG